MFTELLRYQLGDGVEAFSTRRDSELPYPVIQGHQVHGGKVAIIDRPDYTRDELEGYDAFVTNIPNVAIGVRTADCVPILLYDSVKRVVSAVHSGWKGTVLYIVRNAVEVMHQRFQCNNSDLRAILGPSIGPDSFQVGEEVVEHFKNAGFPLDRIWSFHGSRDGSPMSGGHHINLWEANRYILLQSGVRDENIEIVGIDTYTSPDFYSARREGVQCGRIINSIKLI